MHLRDRIRLRIGLLSCVEANVLNAQAQVQRIRGLTNWHQLGGNTRIEIAKLRDELAAAVASVDAMLVEDTDP